MITDITRPYPIISDSPDLYIPLLPWGSIEPHGETLPYLTDSILAGNISIGSASKCLRPCIVLPPVSMGSQNPGQWDKPVCLHFSQETQKSVLSDIVTSLERQGFRKLVIVNGHNGNSFKGIVRGTEFGHPSFKIYVCNYLDVVECMKPSNSIPFPDTDDHAGFTEASLMLHYCPELVDTGNTPEGVRETTGYGLSTMWTPRDWDRFSVNTRIGDASEASARYGSMMAEFITDRISEDLDKK